MGIYSSEIIFWIDFCFRNIFSSQVSFLFFLAVLYVGLPWWLSGKESACNAENSGSIPGLGRSPGEGNGYQIQYSCLENTMDRRARQAIVHGVAKSLTQLKQFTMHASKKFCKFVIRKCPMTSLPLEFLYYSLHISVGTVTKLFLC